jgi:FeS assembly SUF system regulator
VIKLTRQADYGVVLLAHLANNYGCAPQNARVLSAHTQIPLPMAGKILKALVRGGIVNSHRGVNGGYELSRMPALVTIADVIETLEGPIALTDCSEGSDACCELESTCVCRNAWQNINIVVQNALADISLEEIIRPPCAQTMFQIRSTTGRESC